VVNPLLNVKNGCLEMDFENYYWLLNISFSVPADFLPKLKIDKIPSELSFLTVILSF
jgi:hypothetical protein